MMRVSRLLVLLAVTTSCASTSTDRLDPRRVAAIEHVLRTSYVDAVYRERQPERVRSGFAPTFVMHVHWNGALSNRPLEPWIAKMKESQRDTPPARDVRADIRVMDITGDTAVARLDHHADGRHVFTDYYGLYETGEGWKIVSKFFYAHP